MRERTVCKLCGMEATNDKCPQGCGDDTETAYVCPYCRETLYNDDNVKCLILAIKANEALQSENAALKKIIEQKDGALRLVGELGSDPEEQAQIFKRVEKALALTPASMSEKGEYARTVEIAPPKCPHCQAYLFGEEGESPPCLANGDAKDVECPDCGKNYEVLRADIEAYCNVHTGYDRT